MEKYNLNNAPYNTEQLKVLKKSIIAKVNVLRGKEGNTWVLYCNSLNPT